MIEYLTRKLQKNKGAPRVWLDGKAPIKAGFFVGKKYGITVDQESKRITLHVSEDGYRTVVGKEVKDKVIPVLDINSQILSMFDGMNSVRIVLMKNKIHIVPEIVEVKRLERLNKLKNKLVKGAALAVGSLSHGGGILSHALHHAFKKEGLQTKLVWANDIREDLLNHAQGVNDAWDDETMKIAAPLQYVTQDKWLLEKMGSVDILECGLPCEASSVAGRSKNSTSMAEAHEQVGHLVANFLQVISVVNPAIITLENVKPYGNTASMWIIRHSLRDMGYEVHETVLDATEFNELEKRERLCMVAVTKGIEFDFDKLQKPTKTNRQLKEILEDIAEDDACWNRYDYLKSHEKKHADKGNGFAMQVFDGSEYHINVLRKGYNKAGTCDPMIAHPSNPDLMRLLTVKEHGRAKGIPEALGVGLGKTIGHEMYGQSICYQPFVAVFRLVATFIKAGLENGFKLPAMSFDLLAAA